MSKNKFQKIEILIISIVSCISIGLTGCKDKNASDSEVLNIERPADIGTNSSSNTGSVGTNTSSSSTSYDTNSNRSDYNTNSSNNSNTTNNSNLNTDNNFSTDNPANNANIEPNYSSGTSRIKGGNTGSTLQGN